MNKFYNILSLVILMCFALFSNAQKFEWLTAGGSKYDQYISSFTTDTAGNIYAVGFANDSLVIQNKVLGKGTGMFLAKFSSKGTILFLKRFGSGLSTKASEVVYDSAGYLYICGNYTNSKITFGNVTISNPVSNAVRPFIAKTDLNGNGVWGVNVNRGNSSTVNIMKYHPNDSLIVVGGRYWGNTELYFGTKDTFKTRGSYDCFVSAYSSVTGAFKWVELGATRQWDATTNMDVDDYGNTYVTFIYEMINTADSFKSQQLTIPCTHSYDGVIVKFNKHGKVLWHKVVSGRRYQSFTSMHVGSDGAIYSSCYLSDLDTANFFGSKFKPAYKYGMNLLKLDTSGEVLKKRSVYIDYLGHIVDIQTDSNHDVYVLGQNGFKLDTIDVKSNSKSNFFIVKLDSGMNALKAVRGGNSNLHPIYDMVVKPDGDILLGGATELYKDEVFKIRTKSYVAKGDLDVFLTKWNFDDTCHFPVAKMKISPKQNSYELTNQSIGDVDIIEWNISDSIRQGEVIDHSFTKSGVYHIQLVAINQCGTDTIRDSIYHKCIPLAKFDYEIKGRKVEFEDKSINGVELRWDFGNGVMDSIATPSTYFPNKGKYGVELITTGVCGIDTITKEIEITCDLPKADFIALDTHYQVILQNKSVGSQTYTWDFGDGTTSFAYEPLKTYQQTGQYEISLEVKNKCGLDTFKSVVDITCSKPLITIDIEVIEDTVKLAGKSFGFRMKEWEFDLGDGNIVDERVVEHVYSYRDSFYIILKAENVCGKDTVSKWVDVSCAAPVVDFTFEVTKDTVDFTTEVNSMYPVDLEYTLGDGSNSQSKDFRHIYGELDSFLVEVVGNSVCGSDMVIKVVDLRCKPIADFEVEVLDSTLSLTNTTMDSDSFTWKVGGEVKSNLRNPIITHTDTGWVHIQLIAVNECGQDTFEKAVYVPCPTMRLRLDHTVTGTVVDFAIRDSSNTALEWEWEFGDGEKDTGRVLAHDYKESGDYNLKVRVLNSCHEVILEYYLNVPKTNDLVELYEPIQILIDPIAGEILVIHHEEIRKMKLFNLSGQEVSSGVNKLSTDGLAKGVYILRILDSSGRWVEEKVGLIN